MPGNHMDDDTDAIMTGFMSQFYCPITKEVMTDPVQAEDGFCYERSAIERHLASDRRSPMTRQPLNLENLHSVPVLKETIERYEHQRQTLVSFMAEVRCTCEVDDWTLILCWQESANNKCVAMERVRLVMQQRVAAARGSAKSCGTSLPGSGGGSLLGGSPPTQQGSYMYNGEHVSFNAADIFPGCDEYHCEDALLRIWSPMSMNHPPEHIPWREFRRNFMLNFNTQKESAAVFCAESTQSSRQGGATASHVEIPGLTSNLDVGIGLGSEEGCSGAGAMEMTAKEFEVIESCFRQHVMKTRAAIPSDITLRDFQTFWKTYLKGTLEAIRCLGKLWATRDEDSGHWCVPAP